MYGKMLKKKKQNKITNTRIYIYDHDILTMCGY